MKIEIKHRLTGSVLFEIEIGSLKLAVEAAVKSSADLRYADLRSADLRSANLYSANLRYANLRSADLRSANLYSADLRYANLRSADLRSADLRFANLRFANLQKGKTTINWESHDLIAEILRRASGDDIEKLKIAGLLLVCREWCWEQFAAIDDPLKAWAFEELQYWVIDGDDAPDVLKTSEMKA